METTLTLTVTVNAEGNLEIPPELQTQLTPGDQYKVAITEEGLLFKKVKKGFDWDIDKSVKYNKKNYCVNSLLKRTFQGIV